MARDQQSFCKSIGSQSWMARGNKEQVIRGQSTDYSAAKRCLVLPKLAVGNDKVKVVACLSPRCGSALLLLLKCGLVKAL